LDSEAQLLRLGGNNIRLLSTPAHGHILEKVTGFDRNLLEMRKSRAKRGRGAEFRRK
jgi:hypothetical protein